MFRSNTRFPQHFFKHVPVQYQLYPSAIDLPVLSLVLFQTVNTIFGIFIRREMLYSEPDESFVFSM
jgi:hypothetical protein